MDLVKKISGVPRDGRDKPFQDVTINKVKISRGANEPAAVGELIVWPSLVTHPHQATPLQRGVKYGLTIWFELPSF